MSSTVQVYPLPPWARPVDALPCEVAPAPELQAGPVLLRTRFELAEQAGSDSIRSGWCWRKSLPVWKRAVHAWPSRLQRATLLP